MVGCEKNEALDGTPDILPLNLEGLTWSHTRADLNGERYIDSVIVHYDEILGYDSVSHTFLIDNEAGERIRDVWFPTSGIGFIFALDSTLIYKAYFVPGYSSMALFNEVCVEPYSYRNKYRFNLGYPGPDYYTGDDPRNDHRIIERLKVDGKLIEIDK